MSIQISSLTHSEPVLSQTALDYFRSRSAVFFLSYCRFWEKHPFVQQSLARLLVENGVDVYWLDGTGWRRYEPTLYWQSRRLTVQQIPELPIRRIPFVQTVSAHLQGVWIRRLLSKYENPVVWVQGGISEGLASALPYIDIYSSFDDPYRHTGDDLVLRKAKTIICQNTYTHKILSKSYPSKTQVIFPPILQSAGPTHEASKGVPFARMNRSQTAGYIGSFFEKDYNLDLFHEFVQKRPDWNFILVGRTDEGGQEKLKQMSHYKNFYYRPWVSPIVAQQLWNRLSYCFLFYRDNPTQYGAFPIKVVEATKNKVQCLGTDVIKNRDLQHHFHLSNSFENLNAQIDQKIDFNRLEETYRTLSSLTDPYQHLAAVAESLREH